LSAHRAGWTRRARCRTRSCPRRSSRSPGRTDGAFAARRPRW
jgi:hypothetical protein